VLGKHVYVSKPSGEKIGIGEAIGLSQRDQPQLAQNRSHAR
jgi:hypothetical protein